MREGEEAVRNLKRKRDQLVESPPTARDSPARNQLPEAFHQAKVNILKEERNDFAMQITHHNTAMLQPWLVICKVVSLPMMVWHQF